MPQRPDSIMRKGKRYSLITIHSTRKAAEATQKRYKNKGWWSVIITKTKGRRHSGHDYTVYGKYRK